MVREKDFTVASIVAPTSVIEEQAPLPPRCRRLRARRRSRSRAAPAAVPPALPLLPLPLPRRPRPEEVRASRARQAMSDTPLLIAGLGNPGAEYARNRHNAGFMAVDTIHASYDFGPWRARFQGAVSEGPLAGRKTYLLKPMTCFCRRYFVQSRLARPARLAQRP